MVVKQCCAIQIIFAFKKKSGKTGSFTKRRLFQSLNAFLHKKVT